MSASGKVVALVLGTGVVGAICAVAIYPLAMAGQQPRPVTAQARTNITLFQCFSVFSVVYHEIDCVSCLR